MFLVIFLGISILFVVILRIFITKGNRSQQDVEENFWEREREANFTRRKDISNLNYLTIPLEKIPQNLHTDAENTLVHLASCRMLNLSGKTNTDLKLEYGAANLDELSSYDENFAKFENAVSTYSEELVEAGQTDAARELLELAISYQSEKSNIYTQLADIYKQSGDTSKIQELLSNAESLNSFSKNLISEKLQPYLT